MRTMTTKGMNGIGLGGAALTLVLLATIVAVPAWAQGKKGPRASLASATQCALDLTLTDGAFLVVTTTLTNKSSENKVPEVRAGSMIQGTYKDKGSRGQAFEILGTVLIEPVPQAVDSELTLTAEFSLCNVDGTVRAEVDGARELNGLATINYGLSGSGGETRTVVNRCSDDPDTPENEGAIKVADVFDDIAAACAALP